MVCRNRSMNETINRDHKFVLQQNSIGGFLFQYFKMAVLRESKNGAFYP